MLLSKKSRVEFFLTLSFLFVVFFKALESLSLCGHGDAVSYHLVIGRYILEHGFSYAHFNFYLSSLGGLFDYVYVLPQWLFGSSLLAHVFSQFLHFLSSLGLGILLFKKCLKNQNLFLLASLCLLTFARSPDFFVYAKNDGFLALIFFVGVLITFKFEPFSEKSIKYRPVLVGICLGLLPAIKMSGLIYSAVLFFAYVYINHKKPRDILVAILPAIVISSTIFLRNWLVIGNPFFPAFLDLFPTKITPEMMNFMNSMLKTPASLVGVLRNYMIAFSPKAIGWIALPMFYLNYRAKRRNLNSLLLLILAFTTLYSLVNPGYPAERFYFPCHFVLFFYIFKTLSHYKIEKKYLYLLLFIIFADSKIDKVVGRVYNYYHDLYQVGLNRDFLNKRIPFTKIWNYVEPNSRVVSDSVPMVYYSPPGVRMYQSGHSHEANFLWRCNPEDVEKFKSFNAAILVEPMKNKCSEAIVSSWRLAYKVGKWSLYKP